MNQTSLILDKHPLRHECGLSRSSNNRKQAEVFGMSAATILGHNGIRSSSIRLFTFVRRRFTTGPLRYRTAMSDGDLLYRIFGFWSTSMHIGTTFQRANPVSKDAIILRPACSVDLTSPSASPSDMFHGNLGFAQSTRQDCGKSVGALSHDPRPLCR